MPIIPTKEPIMKLYKYILLTALSSLLTLGCVNTPSSNSDNSKQRSGAESGKKVSAEKKVSYADNNESRLSLTLPDQDIKKMGSKEVYEHGYRFEIGDGVKQDYEKAKKLYRHSAGLGNAKAKFRLGFLLIPDNAPNANASESLKFMQKSELGLKDLWEEKKDIESALYLGKMYYHGYGGVEKNNESALKWLKRAVDGENYKENYRVYLSLDDLYGTEKVTKYGDLTKKSYKNALDPIRKMASSDVVYAQKKLGDMYNYGQGVTQNYEEALRWYRKAANQGDAISQFNVGLMYYNGHGEKGDKDYFPLDYEKAFKWFSLSEHQGYVQAQLALAQMYTFNLFVKQSHKTALMFYHKAAEQGDKRAEFQIGLAYFNGDAGTKDYKKALKWFKKAADHGHVKAQVMVGVMHFFGDGIEKNYKTAIEWYKKAAKNGSKDAKSRLSYLYLYGVHGVKKNIAEGVRLVRESGDNNLGNLGMLHELGWGMDMDKEKAANLYNKDKDNFWLGKLYYLGDGVEKKVDYGKSLIEKSFSSYKAKKDISPYDQYAFGYIYEHGIGVNKNEKTALKWYIKSTEGDYPVFQSYLSIAKLYEKEAKKGDDNAAEKAKEWYKLTYDKMDEEAEHMVYAQYVLGLLYEEGKGTDKNINQAKRLYEKAAKHGSQKAQQRLDQWVE